MNREEKAAEFIKQSGKTVHSSDCATSIAPAEEPGPCDCELGDGEPSPPPPKHFCGKFDWCVLKPEHPGQCSSYDYLFGKGETKSGAAQEVSPLDKFAEGGDAVESEQNQTGTTSDEGNSEVLRSGAELTVPPLRNEPSAIHFEIIKYNAMCWKVYLGNSYLGAHNTEQQAANFVKNLEINMRKFVGGDTRELKAALRWIPVQEKLPEYGTVSLVYGYNDDCEKIPYRDIATYSYHGGWCVGLDKSVEYVVTHWQYLPEPGRVEMRVSKGVSKNGTQL